MYRRIRTVFTWRRGVSVPPGHDVLLPVLLYVFLPSDSVALMVGSVNTEEKFRHGLVEGVSQRASACSPTMFPSTNLTRNVKKRCLQMCSRRASNVLPVYIHSASIATALLI
jgi:hypothetical protein